MNHQHASRNTTDIHIRRGEKSDNKLNKDPLNLEIVAIIPLRTHTDQSIDLNETLVRRCAESIRESSYIDKVIVSADDPKLVELAKNFSNVHSILRPESLSKTSVRVSDVLKYTLNELNKEGYEPDVLVPVEITYPFRPSGIFDKVIEMLVSNDFDTVIAGVAEYRICWKKEGDKFVSITELSRHRSERTPLHIGLPSLACAIYPEIIRRGQRYGEKIGIHEVEDPFAAIEVRTPEQLESIARQMYWPE